MTKEEILKYIKEQVEVGNVTKQELLSIAQPQTEQQTGPIVQVPSVQKNIVPENRTEDSSKNVTGVLYSIGAIIAIVGVGILVGQNWQEIGFAGRILSTLGIAVVVYVAGLLIRGEEHRNLSQVMFTLAAGLAPFGVFVLLDEADISFDWSAQLMTAIVLCIFFAIALFISKRNILILLTTGFATWAYLTLVNKFFGFSFSDENVLIKWAVILLGISYILLAYGLQTALTPHDQSDEEEKIRVRNFLYGFGSLAILAAGISIGGVFDVFFVLFIFAAFYGSVFLKSRAMLSFGALFLMAHIIKLTSKYFVDSIGWPVALIFIGFLLIGVGYLTYYLNKKFIQ